MQVPESDSKGVKPVADLVGGRRLVSGYRHLVAPLVLYSLFMLMWWLLSDQLLSWLIGDNATRLLLGFIKDWLLLLLSAVVFALLLIGQDRDKAPSELVHYRRRLTLIYSCLAGITLLLAAVGNGYSIQQQEKVEITRLQAIADLKVEELTHWMQARRRSVEYLQYSAEVVAQYHRWQEQGSPAAALALQDRLRQVRLVDQHQSVQLLDSEMQLIWRTNADDGPLPAAVPDEFDPELLEVLQQSSLLGEVRRLGPYLDTKGQVRLDIIVPLQVSDQGPLPVILLRANPAETLFPSLQHWPVPSASGDVVLFRKQGDQVFFLNTLRYRQHATLRFQMPLAHPQLLAAKVLRGQVRQGETVSGVDYRDIPSIGVVRAIPDTSWFLLAKMDQHELYQGAVHEVRLVSSLALMLLLVLFFIMVFIYQAQKLLLAHSVQDLQGRQLRAQRLLSAIADSSTEPIFAKDLDGRYTLCNQAASSFIGLPTEQILGRTDRDFFPAPQAARLRLNDQTVLARQCEMGFEVELETLAGGNRTFLSNKGPLRDEQGQIIGIYGISKDITTIKQIEKNLRDNENRLKEAQRIARVGSWEFNASEQQLSWSAEIFYLLELPQNSQLARFSVFFRRVHPDDRDEVMQVLRKAQAEGDSFELIHRLLLPDGRVKHVLAKGQYWKNPAGKLQRAVGTIQDITVQKNTEDNLKLAANVFSHAREGIMITGKDGRILDVNNAFSEITGFSRDEVLGENPSILQSGRQGSEFYQQMWQRLSRDGHWSGEIWNRNKDGEMFLEQLTISAVRDDTGSVQHYVALLSDITELKQHQQQLEHIAHYDALTGLPNRLLLADRIMQAMNQVKRRQKMLAVVYLDLDGFKEVNDGYGHDAGDQLLSTLASRMKEALRESDTLARLGGDEFVAVLHDLDTADDSHPVLERMLQAAAKPVHIDRNVLQVSASAGVTFFPQDEEVEADQLLRQADQAMYQAKLSGKNRYYLFDSEEDRNLRGHHESLDHITRALEHQEFVLYYQPKVHMRSGAVEGVEALIRWQHPERGLLSPDSFLPVIENHPLSIELGEWVLQQALQQQQSWQEQGLLLPVSVNVGAHQLQQPDFVQWLQQQLQQFPRLQAGSLMLEVLETSALEDMAHVSRIIRDCEAFGVRFAMDDFGTGYSSLTYLKRLPAQQLKIDQSFVRDMLVDPEDLAILDGVLGLAQAFRREAIAEGVESEAQGEMLLQLGCELAQGYYIAKPMPAEELLPWVKSWRPPALWQDTQRISRDDVPLLFAGTEHRAWMRRLENTLLGMTEDESELEMSHTACNFGRWLNNEAPQRYDDSQLLLQLRRTHLDLHQLAGELLEWQRQGQAGAALLRVAELNEKRDELLRLLRRMLLLVSR